MSEMSLQEVCRLCLSKDNLVWVFDTRLDRTDHMKDVILITTGVEIHSKDVISQKICTKCGQDVIKMFQFRQQSQKNDRHLKDQCRQILKSTDLKIPNTNVTIKTEKVDKEEINQEPTCRKPSYKVHPSMTALSRKYPQLQFPSICLLSNVDPCVSMEMDAVERYFRSRNLNMNEYVQRAIASAKNTSKKSSDDRKSSVKSTSKIGPINIKLVQSEYKIVKNPRKRRHSEDAVQEPVKKISSTDPCSSISQNTVVKPDVQMKNDNILASLGNKVPNLETITDLLANIGNLQSMSNDEYTQTELPTSDSIEMNKEKFTAELKDLKPLLHSHKIPVFIRHGPGTVSYSFQPKPPKSSNLKLWNDLTPIDMKPKKQAIGDKNSNSEHVNTKPLAPHSNDNTEANNADKAKSPEPSNDHKSVQNNATIVLRSFEPHETQSSQEESVDVSTSATASATVPILSSLLTTSPQSNAIKTHIPGGKNSFDFQGGIFNSLEITPVPATAPIRRNSSGTDRTSLRSDTVIRSISNSDSRDGSPKQAVAPMSDALNSMFTSICSDSRVISPLQAKSPEIGTVIVVNPFQSPTPPESSFQTNPPVSYGFNYNSTSYISSDSRGQSHRQIEASHVMVDSIPANPINTPNFQYEFSNFPTTAGQVPTGVNSSSSKVGVHVTKQRTPRIKVSNKPNKSTMQENTAGQYQGIPNYYNNNFPGIVYSRGGSQSVFDNTTSLQNNVLHNNTFRQPRMPPPRYPTSGTPAIRRNLPHNLPYTNASTVGTVRESSYEHRQFQCQVEESLRTTVRSNNTFYPPNPFYSANSFNASNLLRHIRPLENRKTHRPPGVSETSGAFDLNVHSKYSPGACCTSVYASVTVNSRYQSCAPSDVSTSHARKPTSSTAIDSCVSSDMQPSGSIRVRNVCELT